MKWAEGPSCWRTRAFFDPIGSDRRSKPLICRDFLTSDRFRSLGNRSGGLLFFAAFCALLGCACLSGWHSALPHAEATTLAGPAEHHHRGDPDPDLHLAAHSIAGVMAPARAADAVQPYIARPGRMWIAFIATLPAGIRADTLLRPPQG